LCLIAKKVELVRQLRAIWIKLLPKNSVVLIDIKLIAIVRSYSSCLNFQSAWVIMLFHVLHVRRDLLMVPLVLSNLVLDSGVQVKGWLGVAVLEVILLVIIVVKLVVLIISGQLLGIGLSLTWLLVVWDHYDVLLCHAALFRVL